ncbi:MAG: hypothetical protein AAB621_03200, partial [Patescibacteria group bacterium]
SPDGAVFFFECLQKYDLATNTIVLRADYEAFELLGGNLIVFQSEAPHTCPMSVCKDRIAKITDLAKSKVIFQS